MSLSTAGPDPDALISPVMRFLWQEARESIHTGLAAAGFYDVRAEHLAVLQYPGPDGVAPSALAARSGMSPQAINHLLRQLEAGGYLDRRRDSSQPARRVIRLRPRGVELMRQIISAVAELETEWASELGETRFQQLASLLTDLQTTRERRLRP